MIKSGASLSRARRGAATTRPLRNTESITARVDTIGCTFL